MGVKAIIFDIGGVFLTDKLESIYDKIAKDLGLNPEEFSAFMAQHKKELLKGEISATNIAELLKKDFKITADILQIWENAYLHLMNINTKVLNLVQELKNNYVVAAISNTNEFHSAINKKRGAYSYFNPMLISSDIGMMKPEKPIFQKMLEELKLQPAECIYIDDREEHLDTAKSMGFNAIHYQNHEQLVEKLAGYNIF